MSCVRFLYKLEMTLYVFFEEIFLSHWPTRLLPYIVTRLRIADPGLFSEDMIVTCEISMRRTYVILKSDGHYHRTLDPVGEVLDIEIAQSPEHILL